MDTTQTVRERSRNIIRSLQGHDQTAQRCTISPEGCGLVEHFVNSLQAVSAYFNAKI